MSSSFINNSQFSRNFSRISKNFSRRSSNPSKRSKISIRRKSSDTRRKSSDTSPNIVKLMPRTAPMTGKRKVMSEAFMMKSYYYPKGDNPNSINGTLVIDFNLDKNQKPLQKGGAVRECSDPATGLANEVPLNTFNAIYACLHLSAAMDYLTTAEDILIAAYNACALPALPANRAAALAAAARAAGAADANIRAASTAAAVAARAAAAAAAQAAATANGAILAAARAAGAAAGAAASARVNALAAADVSFTVSELMNAKFRYDMATKQLNDAKIKFGKIISGIPAADAAAMALALSISA